VTKSKPETRKRKRQDLIPYSQLPNKTFRIAKLSEEITHLAGKNHTNQDIQQLLTDTIDSMKIRFVSSEEKILKQNVSSLLKKFSHQFPLQKAMTAILTDGLPPEKSESLLTQLSKRQLDYAKNDLSKIDWTKVQFQLCSLTVYDNSN
jgi:uncharacterized membrane protein YheB (UPF0754 family)